MPFLNLCHVGESMAASYFISKKANLIYRSTIFILNSCRFPTMRVCNGIDLNEMVTESLE